MSGVARGAGGTAATCSAPGGDASGVGGSGLATLAIGGGCAVQSTALVAPRDGGPAGVHMPYGALTFTAAGCASATVTVSYSGSVAGMSYWKDIHGGWTSMPATLSGNTATFTIADNGPYDADTTVGTIRDPSGVGVTSSGIPTLSQWAMILLVGLLGWLGSGRLRGVWR